MIRIVFFLLTFIGSQFCFSQDSVFPKLQVAGGVGYSHRLQKHERYNTEFNPGISFTGELQYSFTKRWFINLNYHHTSHAYHYYDMRLSYILNNTSLNVGYLQPLSEKIDMFADLGCGVWIGKYPDYDIKTYNNNGSYEVNKSISDGPSVTISGNSNLGFSYKLTELFKIALKSRYAISKMNWYIDSIQFSSTPGFPTNYGNIFNGEITPIYQYLNILLLIQVRI
ncbi:MAG: hypothetical protein ACKVPJ_13045 [Chitinophagales bacterium]